MTKHVLLARLLGRAAFRLRQAGGEDERRGSYARRG